MSTEVQLRRNITIKEGKFPEQKHVESDDDFNVHKQIEVLVRKLEEKAGEIEDLEALNRTLMVKERRSNLELQEARKELIDGLQQCFNSATKIGVKRMGELDQKPFRNICVQKFPAEDWNMESVKLCSLWQENIKSSDWHPFRKTLINGDLQVCSQSLKFVYISSLLWPYSPTMKKGHKK
ncbi:PREDICTED: factor of DNA methylation 1-like [Nelumbo nucifera]|uniref:Factor of DNA methylation 1-like n=1 Tax=Nelumbo nucifera TaxID=4432 RepID=A0A1U8Q5J0_NELNU|nr:PREDICTED: factor of DNA methylation 1-like [Nelumbo nucifera]